jgi:hypothetical protein
MLSYYLQGSRRLLTSPSRTARRLPRRLSRRRPTTWPCPRLFRLSARPLVSTTSPRVAPPESPAGLGRPCAQQTPRGANGEEAALAEVQRLDAAVKGPSAVLASSFEVEILPPESLSEAGPDSAEGGNDAERAAPPPADV